MSLNAIDLLSIRNAASLSMPSANRSNITDNTQPIDVGQPRTPTGWTSQKIRYHNFASLPLTKGEHTDSIPFRACGLEWYLRLHPGGAASANDNETFVSLYLRCKTSTEQNVEITAEFSLAILNNLGGVDTMMSCPVNSFKKKRKGWPNFISRSRLLDRSNNLVDSMGSITVVVNIQLFQQRESNTFVPRNNDVGLIRLLLEANKQSKNDQEDTTNDQERSNIANTSDVKFSIGDEIFHSHRLILKLSAPALAQLCEDVDEDTPVPIINVRSPIFQGVLRFIYGDSIPESIWTTPVTNSGDEATPAMELLDAAHQFGITSLKILAETKVANESEITIGNASDLILYADSKHCALLKERVLNYFVIHATEIRKHPSYEKVKESAHILDELMEAVVTKKILRAYTLGDNDVAYDVMSVNLLRTKLNERGLDLDGSREMLIRRLQVWDTSNKKTVVEEEAAASEEAAAEEDNNVTLLMLQHV